MQLASFSANEETELENYKANLMKIKARKQSARFLTFI